MKSIRKLGLALGVAAICLTVSPLTAQVLAGSFTLPHEVYWGQATLPAGSYTFTLDRTGLDGKITVSRGTKVVAFILVGGTAQANYDTGSSILIMEHRVRSLRLANLGIEYDFPAHKKDRELLARRAGVQGVAAVPVSTK